VTRVHVRQGFRQLAAYRLRPVQHAPRWCASRPSCAWITLYCRLFQARGAEDTVIMVMVVMTIIANTTTTSMNNVLVGSDRDK
jgi:hypothetical protein